MLKKTIKLIKQYLGEIILTSGVGIFAYNIFNFSGLSNTQVVIYKYQDDQLLFITLGAMLIVSGFLIIRNKKMNIIFKK